MCKKWSNGSCLWTVRCRPRLRGLFLRKSAPAQSRTLGRTVCWVSCSMFWCKTPLCPCKIRVRWLIRARCPPTLWLPQSCFLWCPWASTWRVSCCWGHTRRRGSDVSHWRLSWRVRWFCGAFWAGSTAWYPTPVHLCGFYYAVCESLCTLCLQYTWLPCNNCTHHTPLQWTMCVCLCVKMQTGSNVWSVTPITSSSTHTSCSTHRQTHPHSTCPARISSTRPPGIFCAPYVLMSSLRSPTHKFSCSSLYWKVDTLVYSCELCSCSILL